MTNESILIEIIKRDSQGATPEELKHLYVERNIINCNPDSSIYRIIRTDFFIEDLKNSEITFANISPEVFGDVWENPLVTKIFNEGNDYFTLGFLENYYALCWTTDPTDEAWRWDRFLERKSGVRIKVSLRKFMHRLMNVKDNFFMLHYFAVGVTYKDFKAIDDLASDQDYKKYLDSLGQNALPLVTTLADHLADEKEIRILYSHTPGDNIFITENIKVTATICKIPFNWMDIIEEILIAGHISESEHSYIDSQLRDLGISCSIKRSHASG